MNLWVGCGEEFIIHVLRGCLARTLVKFPKSDPVWSSFMCSGSGPARASRAFSGSDTGMLTPDVIVDVSMSSDHCTFREAVSISLFSSFCIGR
ncbi:hypothetical protein Tco_1317116 [Tanacetum coccineum]